MAQETTVKKKEAKVGYSATAAKSRLDAAKSAAHDMRIPFTKFMEGLMQGYIETGNGYVDPTEENEPAGEI